MHAIRRDTKIGAMLIDYNLCVGCKLCVVFCPFGGTEIDAKTGKIMKCDLCDGNPVCAKFCEPQALQFVDATTANLRKRMAAAEKFSELMRKLLASP